MPKGALFLDSAYAIALSSPKDEHHPRALALADKVDEEGIWLITTRAVVVEIGNHLSSSQYRQDAIKLLSSFEEDTEFVEIVPMSEPLYRKAFQLYRMRPAKFQSCGKSILESSPQCPNRQNVEILSGKHAFSKSVKS